MTASFTPAGAAEFPNDNPGLHQGVRWVCLAERGPARALRLGMSPCAAELPPPPPAAVPVAALPLAALPGPAAPRPIERRYEGPLQLDLGRIVLPHRVENVPPPPDFIFKPFVSSRSGPALVVASARPIYPRPCRSVDHRDACRRIERSRSVDVAPCVHVGAVELPRRQSRHRGGVVACPAPRRPAAEPPPLELEAASA